MNTVCRICGNKTDNKIHHVKERILNKGDEFHYLECSRCKSWMMIDQVEMKEWYPKNYNPYLKKNNDNWLFKLREYFLIEYIIWSRHKNFEKVLQLSNVDILFKRLCGTRIKRKDAILDVGCANGHWLDVLADMGWKHITGLDLYMPAEKMKNKKWKFLSSDIFGVNHQQYDFISLIHSFEHMENPLEVLKKINSLLKKDGLCMISIPLADGMAHRMYGEYFCQLDAPRHLYLLSKRAMGYLCKKAGLKIEYISYDSNAGVFSLSDGYKNTDKSHGQLTRENMVSPTKISRYKEMAEKSNRLKEGDQAIFYIRKQ